MLLDVGGTLWPDRVAFGEEHDERLHHLQALLPSVEPDRALAICNDWPRRAAEPLEHDVVSAVASALPELGLESATVPAAAVVRALCQPAVGRIQLFDSAGAGARTASRSSAE